MQMQSDTSHRLMVVLIPPKHGRSVCYGAEALRITITSRDGLVLGVTFRQDKTLHPSGSTPRQAGGEQGQSREAVPTDSGSHPVAE